MWRRKHHRIHWAAGETLCFLEESKRCKGVKKSIVSKSIHLEDYKNCLFTGKEQLQTMNIIRSRKHELFTEQVNKVALSANDDKRIIQPDKINTLAHGYRTGWHGKPTREPTGRQGNQQGDWQGRPGKVTGEATGFEQRGLNRDRGKLAKTPRDLEKRRSNTEKYTTLTATHSFKTKIILFFFACFCMAWKCDVLIIHQWQKILRL